MRGQRQNGNPAAIDDLEQKQAVYEAAKEYAVHKLKVLRLEPRGERIWDPKKEDYRASDPKKPIDLGWAEQPIPSPDQIDKWFKPENIPSGNAYGVGVQTGVTSDHGIVDVDGETGFVLLRLLGEEFTDDDMRAAKVTPSGGLHTIPASLAGKPIKSRRIEAKHTPFAHHPDVLAAIEKDKETRGNQGDLTS
jgi:hypothetical protein